MTALSVSIDGDGTDEVESTLQELVQDRLKMIKSVLEAQTRDGLESGKNFHGAHALVEHEEKLSRDVACHAGFHLDKGFSYCKEGELKILQMGGIFEHRPQGAKNGGDGDGQENKDDFEVTLKSFRQDITAVEKNLAESRSDVLKFKNEMNTIFEELTATIRHGISAVELNLEESKVKMTAVAAGAAAAAAFDARHVVDFIHGCIDVFNKEVVAAKKNLQSTRNSFSDCLKGVAAVRSDVEQNVADTAVLEHVSFCCKHFMDMGKGNGKGKHWKTI